GLKWIDLHNHFMYYNKITDRKDQQQYWLPDVSLSYRGFNISYRKSIDRPYFYQIVAVVDDLSPNHTTYASPYFENVLNEQFSARYNKYFTKSKMNFSFYGGLNLKDKGIGYERTYNTQTSYSTSRNFQTGPVRNYNFSTYASKTFLQNKVWKFSCSLQLYGYSSREYSRINGEENLGTSLGGHLSNSINLSYKDLITFSPSYGYNFNRNSFKYDSENFKDVNNDSHNLGATLHFHNLKKFKLETSYTLKNQVMNINSGRENLHIVNASLYYPVLTKGELKLSVFDLFAQNVSNYFNSYGNSTNYSSNLSLRQYFMLGMVYKFLNTGKK